MNNFLDSLGDDWLSLNNLRIIWLSNEDMVRFLLFDNNLLGLDTRRSRNR